LKTPRPQPAPAARTRSLAWPLLGGGAVSLIALYLAFRNVPLAELGACLARVDYRYLFLSLVVVVGLQILKAHRWRAILGAAAPVGFISAFHPMMVGFMLNCILPGRPGELARPLILSRRQAIPFATALSTVVAERIMDTVTILALLAWVLGALDLSAAEAIDFAGYRIDGASVVSAGRATFALSLAVVGAVGLLRLEPVQRLIKSLIHRLPLWIPGLSSMQRQWLTERVSRPLAALVDQAVLGLAMVGRPLRLITCVGLSVIIWLLTACSFYILSLGFPGVHLTLAQMTAVMVVISFCIALPSVPGWWGLWEAGGIFALTLMGVAPGPAAGFTLINHAAQLFPVILIGLGSALISGVRIGRIAKTAPPV
jgi:glycosyltransferase 2 family protein